MVLNLRLTWLYNPGKVNSANAGLLIFKILRENIFAVYLFNKTRGKKPGTINSSYFMVLKGF
jgi:hypothetical protein